MSKRYPILILAVLAIFIFAAAPARADVYMKQKTHTGEMKVMGHTQPAKDQVMVFWLGQDKARTDQDDGTSTIMLIDKKVLYLIDHNKKQYSEMPLDLDKMIEEAAAGQGADEAKAAEAKEKMPAFMKNMMKGVMEGMSVKVTETGETKKIGNWACRKYLIEMDMGMGKSSSEAWATEDIKLDYGLYLASANALMAMQPGFEKLVKEMQKVKGVIVLQTTTTAMMGSKVESTTELLECGDKDAPAGAYDVPAGYKKVKNIQLNR